MKKIFTLAILSLTLLSFKYEVSIDEVVLAMKAGNASQVSRYLDNTVDITLPEKSNTYSKSQAEQVIRDFFTNNGVKSFDILHKGDNSGAQYCIGKLFTRTGMFRTTIFMKQKGDRQVIQEIRFEEK